MKLKDLLTDVEILSAAADMHLEITGVSYDSRTTAPGEVFVAIAGETADGAAFIPEAMKRGAVCAVSETVLPGDVPHVHVASCRRALAVMAANWFGHPDREMTLVGVTGTNGKTTVTHLIKRILEETVGAKVGLMGTVHTLVDRQELPAERTTPESWEIHRLLRQMADAGCTHAVMEVSSHALALDRVHALRFAVGVLTNLTQDHLDFHRTMEAYCAAKARLFHCCDAAVYNADDPWAERMLSASRCLRCSYGVESGRWRAEDVTLSAAGVAYTAVSAEESVPVHLRIPGKFSVYNSLAAMAACLQLGIPAEVCAAALAAAPGAKGRMEVVPTGELPYTVIIDYAHTPDALENVLAAVRGFAKGRTVALFGCGGDRDRTKRPLMGAIAASLADFSVVTTDNPRTEPPRAIIEEILSGMEGAACQVIEDRIEAICWALEHAEADDVIVLCGKGHEDYQEIGRTKIHLDEREVVAEYLAGQKK